MTDERSKRLAAFVEWAGEHITGDEKGEAQIFLDRLFQGFGQRGCLDVGGTPEFRVRKGKDSRSGTSFADYVWRGVVLVEMKKRGEPLGRHLRQALDYWFRIVPGRPRYVILCNFDEFWVYDFDVDIDEPLDKVRLDELPDRYGPLAFLFPTGEKPTFKVDREEVTRATADRLAVCYNKLAMRKDVGPDHAQRFVLQMLVALFAEDIGLLDKYFVAQLLEDCTDPPKAFDLLGGLFTAMATEDGSRGGRFKDVPYFNGGIFAKPAPVELAADELAQLKLAAREDWGHVSPEIFGTIFQHSMGEEDRHAFGAHYTSPTDIMKIVKPTIVDPWREAIESADTLDELQALQQRMYSFRVLDPACGSGNFLFIAYRQLKRLEVELNEKVTTLSARAGREQRRFGFVTTGQFYGMDILPFAVELAKVTLMLAHKLAIDELHVDERSLPLDNLDDNIICKDALMDENGARTVWPIADVVIGNPPFLGAKRLKPEHGADYVNAVRKLYPEVPGMADYCVYWFRRAHDHVPECSPENIFGGRVGLVGTQNVRNNKSRVGGLDHVVKSGTIIEAVDNQPWSGEANVHVSIVNWVKHPPPTTKSGQISITTEEALQLPHSRRLWRKGDPSLPLFDGERAKGSKRKSTTVAGKRGRDRKDKSYELVVAEVGHISSTLSDQTDVSGAKVLTCNTKPQRVFQGQVPGHEAFVLSPSEADLLISSNSRNEQVIWPFLIGRDIVTGIGEPSRYVIDFQDIDLLDAAVFKEPFERIKEEVLPVRQKAALEGQTADGKPRPHHQLFLKYWWRHSYDRPDLISTISPLSRYVVCSGVTKRPIFAFVSNRIRPDHAVFVFAFEDDYSFGILQSQAHWLWFTTKCSKLKSDFRYTPPTVFDTLPWPQSVTKKQVRAVAKAGAEIRRLRDAALLKTSGGLRGLYRTLELPGKSELGDAHAALDAAVMDAYGFNPKKDLLAQLLLLNLDVAARIEKDEEVTAPGVPPSYGDPSDLITDDCIQPPE